MGISRDSRHKHRLTGGRMPCHQKKRKYELGRPAAMTKLGAKRIRLVRCRGGNIKFRALRLDTGNFSWATEGVARKCRIIQVVYNASNNELVRTNTLVKGTIVVIDALPFKTWFQAKYGLEIGKKQARQQQQQQQQEQVAEESAEEVKKSRHVLAKERRVETQQKKLAEDRVALMGKVEADPVLEQFGANRVLACISSRPGQSGRADGYILEGAELSFYKRKLEKRKKKN